MALHPKYISLCSGSGAFDLAVRIAVPGARACCYVEAEVTVASVLASRIAEGSLDDAPVWSDLRTFDAAAWRGLVHGVIGGIPCTPFSTAGKRLGEDDPRNLWPDALRIVAESQPLWCFFENVPGMANKSTRWYYRRVVRPGLEALGYRVEEGIFSAAEVGAPHIRERLFIRAYSDNALQNVRQGDDRTRWAAKRTQSDSGGLAEPNQFNDNRSGDSGQGRRPEPSNSGPRPLADPRHGPGSPEHALQPGERPEVPARGGGDGQQPAGWPQDWPPGKRDRAAWARILSTDPGLAPAIQPEAQPDLHRMADGLAPQLGHSVRLHITGNGVVPLSAAFAFRSLLERFRHDE